MIVARGPRTIPDVAPRHRKRAVFVREERRTGPSEVPSLEGTGGDGGPGGPPPVAGRRHSSGSAVTDLTRLERPRGPADAPAPRTALEDMEPMRVLVTGSEGYIGTVLCAYLLDRGHDVTGLDTGFHRVGWLYHGVDRSPTWIAKDIRQITVEDLRRLRRGRPPRRAVERPGRSSSTPTSPSRSTTRAASAWPAWPGRPAWSGSSTCRRAASMARPATTDSTETSDVHPLTAYAKCKVLVERDVPAARRRRLLADLPAQRDGVRRLARGCASTSSSTTWPATPGPRRSSGWTATAGRGARSSTSSTSARRSTWSCGRPGTSSTARSSTSAATPRTTRSARSPRSSPTPSRAAGPQFGDSTGDHRNYRANFDKIHERLPGSRPATTSPAGAQQLLEVFRAVDMSTELFESRGHTRIKQIQHLLATGQIDERFFWVRPSTADPVAESPRRRRDRRSRHEAVAGGPRRLAPDRPRPGSATIAGSSPGSGTRRGPSSSGSTIRNVQTNISTNRHRGTIRGLHWQVAPYGESKLLRCTAARSSTSPSTCDRTRRPTASGRAIVLDAETARRWSSSRSAARTGTRPSRTTPRSATRCRIRTCRAPSAGSAGTTRRSAIAWPITEDVIVSEKDAAWPDLDPGDPRMSAVLRALEARAAAGDPIRVGLVGAGYAGRGFAARIIRRTPGIELVAVSNRTIGEAERAYRDAGVDAPGPRRLGRRARRRRSATIARSSPTTRPLLTDAAGIEAIVEATGEVEFGAGVAVRAIDAGQAPHPHQRRARLVPRADAQDAGRRGRAWS